jgi:hypothetical protein
MVTCCRTDDAVRLAIHTQSLGGGVAGLLDGKSHSTFLGVIFHQMLNGEVSAEESRLGLIVGVYMDVAREVCPAVPLVQSKSEAVIGVVDLVRSELSAVDDLVVVSPGNLILDYAAEESRVEEVEWAEEVDDASSPSMQMERNSGRSECLPLLEMMELSMDGLMEELEVVTSVRITGLMQGNMQAATWRKRHYGRTRKANRLFKQSPPPGGKARLLCGKRLKVQKGQVNSGGYGEAQGL